MTAYVVISRDMTFVTVEARGVKSARRAALKLAPQLTQEEPLVVLLKPAEARRPKAGIGG